MQSHPLYIAHVSTKTRPHHQRWGDHKMETAITRKKAVRWMAYLVGSSYVVSLCAAVFLNFNTLATSNHTVTDQFEVH